MKIGIHSNLNPTGLIFNFQHVLYEKNVLFEQKKKICTKPHFVEHKTVYAACLKNAVTLLVT